MAEATATLRHNAEQLAAKLRALLDDQGVC